METTVDPLERFIQAQERDYVEALSELRAGRKQTHWIWYVLPQLRELGLSQTARHYGIVGLREAEAYWAHPVLSLRLVECVSTILHHSHLDAVDILGQVDAKKFRSCITLFAKVAPDEPVFSRALAVFFQGQPDPQTLCLLGTSEPGDFSEYAQQSNA